MNAERERIQEAVDNLISFAEHYKKWSGDTQTCSDIAVVVQVSRKYLKVDELFKLYETLDRERYAQTWAR